ncbi:FeoA family protein [Wukongibacter baidiensis]|uniref:FeoA family protein n=1 Tax=Wukongibacter baidiensis TaxID=1723361 RepID=UPI003D7F522D
MLLSNIEAGSRVKVVSLQSTGLSRRRMMDLGLIPDAEIEVLRHSPLGDPTAYGIRGAQIALRSEEAKQIVVELIK